MKTPSILFCSCLVLSVLFLANSSSLRSTSQTRLDTTLTLCNVLSKFVTHHFFNAIDTNHDGQISKQEFVNFITSAYRQKGEIPPPVDSIHGSFEKIDTNHSGYITIDELRAWWLGSPGEGIIFDISTQIAFVRLTGGITGTLTQGELTENLQLFAMNHNLGKLDPQVVIGPYYSVLNAGETSFRLRHFQRLVNKVLFVARDRYSQQQIHNEEVKNWPSLTFNGILNHLIIDSIFSAIDTDKNGYIGMNEFINFFKSFHFAHGLPAPVPADLNYLYNLIDVDRNGKVTRAELRHYFENAANQGHNVKLFGDVAAQVAFERLDQDRSGRLSVEEFQKGFTNYANSLHVHGPESSELSHIYNSLTKDGVFNVNDLKSLISKRLLGGRPINSTTSPQRMRNLLLSLMSSQLYNRIDADHNGRISFEEFARYIRDLAIRKGALVPSLTTLRTSFNKIDTDHNGSITYSQLTQFLKDSLVSGGNLDAIAESAALAAFDFLDSNKSGDLSIEEWRRGLRQWSEGKGIEAPSDESLNAAWRHAVGLSNNFSSSAFLNLVGSNFGLDGSFHATARLF